MNIITTFEKIKQEIKNNTGENSTEIIAVSKTFPIEHIMPLIKHGHRHYGENKVQEAEKKWLDLKKTIIDLKLHMIGRLQSNKAKKAVEIFDYIHSLDGEKLAKELSKRQKEKGKNLRYFIQINLGSEEQKGGVELNDLKSFNEYCIKELNLSVLGLMAIPPNDNEPEKHFKRISELNRKFNFQQLSIGMSNDYLQAIKYGASHVRVGSAIFGSRN
tara:strand:- start:668 stop:1315 length:648 start_codon:yes stop_codon:yes gene_type:complete